MSEYNEIFETVTDYLDLPKNVSQMIIKYYRRFKIFDEKDKYVYNKILYLTYFKQKAATMIRKIKILRCNAELEYQEMIWKTVMVFSIPEGKYVEETGYYLK